MVADDVQSLRSGDIFEKVNSTTQKNLQDVWERPTRLEEGADRKPRRIALLIRNVDLMVATGLGTTSAPIGEGVIGGPTKAIFPNIQRTSKLGIEGALVRVGC